MGSGDPPETTLVEEVGVVIWEMCICSGCNNGLVRLPAPKCKAGSLLKICLSLRFVFFGEVCNHIAIENLELDSLGHFGAQLTSPAGIKDGFIKLSNP